MGSVCRTKYPILQAYHIFIGIDCTFDLFSTMWQQSIGCFTGSGNAPQEAEMGHQTLVDLGMWL